MEAKALKRIWILGIILLLIGTSAVAGLDITKIHNSQFKNRGNILYVGGSGPGNYTTIQDAINASSNDDTVFVYAGTYHENVVVNKTITLHGEDNNTTLIDGGGIGNVVLICSDHANISGFTIQNSGSYNLFDAGLSIRANYTNISQNNVTKNNNFGIVIGVEHLHLYHHNNVFNNLISNNFDTNVWVEESDYNTISNNILFHDKTRECVCTRYSHHCTIENNMILNSSYGISLFEGSHATVVHNTIKNCLIIGISLSDQHHCLIGYNTIDNCTYLPWMGHGIHLESHCSDNVIKGNMITNATCTGIWLYSSSQNNTLKKNTIKKCNYYGVWISNACDNNKIFRNNFFLNSPENAYDECTNLWDNGYPPGGNFWDDYLGSDFYHGPSQNISGGDGIGDEPYPIPGGSNHDRYPMMVSNTLMDDPPKPIYSYRIDGFSVSFNATSSYDPDGVLAAWLWDFGDNQSGEGDIVTHNYTLPGTYTVTLTLIDDDGIENSTQKNIHVGNYQKAFIFGSIRNRITFELYTSFEAEKIRMITFRPLTFNVYSSGEIFKILNDYKGLMSKRFIIVLCNMIQ